MADKLIPYAVIATVCLPSLAHGQMIRCDKSDSAIYRGLEVYHDAVQIADTAVIYDQEIVTKPIRFIVNGLSVVRFVSDTVFVEKKRLTGIRYKCRLCGRKWVERDRKNVTEIK